MKYLLITNNSKVFNFYKETDEIIYLKDGDFTDVISFAKDKIYMGHVLLTDPIMSNVADRKNPYKSIAISTKTVDSNKKSVKFIDDALNIGNRMKEHNEVLNLTDKKLKEFRYVDLNLINEGLKFV